MPPEDPYLWQTSIKLFYMTNKIILALIALIAIAGLVFPQTNQVLDTLGNKSASFWDTSDGYKVDGTTVIDGSGNLSIAGTATFDTTTMYVDSTNNRVGIGTTTPQTLAEFAESNATSTVYIRNASTTATTGGRIILEDTDGAGCSQITILNGTVVASTVTCP